MVDQANMEKFFDILNITGLKTPIVNRDEEFLTNLIMTGTTALTRVTAYKMMTKGVLYPAEEIRDILWSADFLHISNEVSFSSTCPEPYAASTTMQFCSQTSNIQLLEDIGADIIELTGNHLIDFGYEPMLETLALYQERGWLIFGGGRDENAAKRAITFSHNGSQIAMIGCNRVGPDFDWADENSPGSAICDFQWMTKEITRLKNAGFIVIATLQDFESESPMPSPSVRDDFLLLEEAGAVIISGSQADSPQGFEFIDTSFIHFGLGNLFF